MKLLEVVDRNKKDEIARWVTMLHIWPRRAPVFIDNNLEISVDGDILIPNEISSLPYKFKYISGYFTYPHATSFENFPSIVGTMVSIGAGIRSLHNIHKYITSIGTPSTNGLFTYVGPKIEPNEYKTHFCTHMLHLCLIKHLSGIVSGMSEVNKIFYKYRHDINLFQDALIDAGYPEQAKV